MAELLGVRQYARHRGELGLPGSSHAAVRKAIATGRLSRSVTRDPRGWPVIDAAIADGEWGDATDQAQQRGAGQASLFPDGREKDVRSSSDGVRFTQARAVRETYAAQLAGLEYREKMGQLVAVADVKAEAFEVGRKVRENLLGIPARIGPVLAGMSDPRACEDLIARELDVALRELSRRDRA